MHNSFLQSFFRLQELEPAMTASGLLHTFLESLPQLIIQAAVMMLFVGMAHGMRWISI